MHAVIYYMHFVRYPYSFKSRSAFKIEVFLAFSYVINSKYIFKTDSRWDNTKFSIMSHLIDVDNHSLPVTVVADVTVPLIFVVLRTV